MVHLTIKELIQEIATSQNSAYANFVALLTLFGYSGSVYHLIYIGLMRFYALWKPINYRILSKSKIYIGLAVVWIFAIISATVPSKYKVLKEG